MKFLSLLLLAAAPAANTYKPDFRDIAREAGLTATFPNGGSLSKEFILETTGSGLAFIDYDGDGLLDLFVLSGPGNTNKMFRNLGNDKFADVTAQVGLNRTGWAQGVCAGDYDNDGYTDLFVTYFGDNVLYRNSEGKRFEDVTKKLGLIRDRPHYGTGCAFVDYDRDGKLDLVVANYLLFDPATTPKPGENPYCFYRNMAVACGPRGLPFDNAILYHNEGSIFRDVSQESGVAKPHANYGLGVIAGDFNGDGWPDIYVACDQTPSLLFMNKKDGTFEEQGLLRGVAFDENGRALSGMGVTFGDVTHNGSLDLFRTNFSDERETLYRSRGGGDYEDVTRLAGMSTNTQYVGWGCGFLDFDRDGWKDLLLVNGHVFPEVEKLENGPHFRERSILYRNKGGTGFQDVSLTSGPAITELHASRGAAFGDIDNDGSVEIAINNQNERVSLLKDAAKPPGHWLLLALEGIKSNRSAIGARVTVVSNGMSQTDEVRSGGSYLSQSDLRLHFGLGSAAKAESIQIEWPSGIVQILRNASANRIMKIREEANARK